MSTVANLSEVESFVRELMTDFIEVAPEVIDMEADIFGLYTIESLQLVEMVTALERRFGIRLDFDEFREIRTAKELAERVVTIGS